MRGPCSGGAERVGGSGGGWIDRRMMRGACAAACAALAVALAACGKKDTLRTLDRVALPDTVAAGARLLVDSLGRAWVGEPGRLTAYDTAGRVVGRMPVPGKEAAAPLWLGGGSVYARTAGVAMRLEPGGARVGAVRNAEAPVAHDPRGRWVYTATRTGSVLGLDAATLKPVWGWPDAGSRVSSLAVSPLGDRVYAALAGSDRNDVPTSVVVYDALSGRILATYEAPDSLRSLQPAPDGTLYALSTASVVALRPGPGGLAELWTTRVGAPGGRADALRVSPTGTRLAVLRRGEWLRLLDAATGAEVEATKQAPRDAGFDVAGRLWVLQRKEIRIVR